MVQLGEARIPDGLRVYAVGDVHGRHDLLVKLFAQIEADAAHAPEQKRELIFLGDYLDRGLYVREAIDWFIAFPASEAGKRFRLTCLKGNHEDLLLKFLNDPEQGRMWLENGAYETLLSFGLRLSSLRPKEETLKQFSQALHLKLQNKYLNFFNNLPLGRTIGDYFFCHAGIDPDRPIPRQKPESLLWIRDKFLQSDRHYEKVIVHGHSISTLPDVRPNRMGIDTGAYGTGRLTCAVLFQNKYHFLQTT